MIVNVSCFPVPSHSFLFVFFSVPSVNPYLWVTHQREFYLFVSLKGVSNNSESIFMHKNLKTQSGVFSLQVFYRLLKYYWIFEPILKSQGGFLYDRQQKLPSSLILEGLLEICTSYVKPYLFWNVSPICVKFGIKIISKQYDTGSLGATVQQDLRRMRLWAQLVLKSIAEVFLHDIFHAKTRKVRGTQGVANFFGPFLWKL